jgi:hypothetical protein
MFDLSSLRRSTLAGCAALGLAAIPGTASALDPFTNGSSALNNDTVSSGAAIAIVDMNADGLDDIVRLHEGYGLEIEYQQDDGSFTHLAWGSVPGSGAWGMAIGDADNNGYPDIFVGGAYDGLKLLLANDDGTDYELTMVESPGGVFVQCVNFADIDTDGALDLFVCHDDGLSAPFAGDGSGGFTYDLGLINPESTVPAGNPNDEHSGNYGITWTDYDLDGDLDLYIAKCRQGINNPDDGRRLNLLFENDGNNNFSDVALDRGLRPPAQSWTADFADIDNDGDFDAYLTTHVSAPLVDHQRSTLFENDGSNNFADITVAAGMAGDIADIDLGIQTHFEDFDNDGFVDLIVTNGAGDHRLFMNNQDRTFTAATNPFPTDGAGVQTMAVGDLNDDGFPDIVAGFATGFNYPSNRNDRIFFNPGNDNNWINVRLTGVESNATAAGAMVELHGEWGVQRREVRAGESYGITNSFTRHFGIGTAMSIDTLVVNWPSGHVDTIPMPPINQTIHITEGCPDEFFEDGDGDGYGNPDATMQGCIAPAGYVADNTDCDDMAADNFPGNVEICDGVDNDCDADVDEDLQDCDIGGSSGDPDTGSTTLPTDGTTSGVSASASNGTASETDGDESSADDGGATDGDGCGCRTPRGGAGWLLALLVLPALRRHPLSRAHRARCD